MAEFEAWLPPVTKEVQLELSHFPTRFQAVIFRLWESVSAEKLAEVLHSDTDTVKKLAYDMGLGNQDSLDEWMSRGYITIIKAVWHLLPYEQIMEILGKNRDELSFIIREDDFLWYKLGECKPECSPVYIRELSDEEKEATKLIRSSVEKYIRIYDNEPAVKPFDFFAPDDSKALVERRECPDGFVEVTNDWFVEDLTGDDDCAQYAGDFLELLNENFGLKPGTGADAHPVQLILDPSLDGKPEEYHIIDVSPEKIVVSAGKGVGIMRGLYAIVTLMNSVNGPYLKPVIRHRTPAMDARFIYSYCGLYGAPLDVDTRISFPDILLKRYAQTGVNGIWIQGVMYKLVRFPFDPSVSEGYEKRQERLRELIARARRWGLKVYLYINEPRAMPLAFFEKYPEIKGFERGDFASMCTSHPDVRKYMREGIQDICRNAPGLGGFFTITVSENQTNCYSHADQQEQTCPRCKGRSRAEVVAEVNSILADAAHEIDPEIRTFAWTWGWKYFGDEERLRAIRLLSKNCIVQNTSEEWLQIEKAGYKLEVDDYTLSNIPPSRNSKTGWKEAGASGHKTSAKVQLNTTWEGSTAPFIPVYENVCKYMENLRKEGVENIQLSWTLGGWPSDNLRIASSYFFDEEVPFTYEEQLAAAYGRYSEAVKKAVHCFCEAFSFFPFHIDMLYLGPQNAGPANLLYEKPTGLNATMTCFAYDDLEHWRSIYPRETFLDLMKNLSEKWNEGIDIVKDMPVCEFTDVAKVCGALFEASYDVACFAAERETMMKDPGDEACRKRMKKLIARERDLAVETYRIMRRRPSIGYEAANHYYFSQASMLEKVVNCEYLLKKGDQL